MDIIRTPEERFANLPDFPFEPNYLTIEGRRIHYVEQATAGEGGEQDQEQEVVLCLHGEPSWSYLYRKMLPILARPQGHRAIAFDFVGFGRSDKLRRKKSYSYEMHFNTLVEFVEQLDLRNITLVVQDWGGLIGLPFAAEYPERVKRLVIMNTMLPAGSKKPLWQLIPRAFPFFVWQTLSKLHPSLPIGRILQVGTASRLGKDVLAAYDAPFPDRSYKAGAAIWPSLVPIQAKAEAALYTRPAREKLKQWTKPCLVLFSDKDPITGSFAGFFRNLIPSAKTEPSVTIKDAGHFLQEDKGEEIAKHIIEFIDRT